MPTSSTKKETILKVMNLSKTFSTMRGRINAVQDVSFEVQKGQFFGIIGESGSGKTTLGRSIIGLYPTTYGSVYFENELINLNRLPRQKKKWRQRSIQMIFQDPLSSLNEKKNVLSIISEPLKIHKESIKDFYDFFRENAEIQKNFRLALKEKFEVAKTEFLKKRFKKALETYHELDRKVNQIIKNFANYSYEELIEFLEVDYFANLIEANYEALKYIRHTNKVLDKDYEEFVDKYRKNEMSEDEIDLKHAEEKLVKLKFQSNINKADQKLENKLLNARTKLQEVKEDCFEIWSFSKRFLKTFTKSIKLTYKEEKTQASVFKDVEKYEKHHQFITNLRWLYKQFKTLDKKVILTQVDTEKIYQFKNTFFRLNVDFSEFEKVFGKITKIIEKGQAKYHAEFTKLDEAKKAYENLVKLKKEVVQKNKEKYALEKASWKEKIALAKKEHAKALQVYKAELVKASEKSKKWFNDYQAVEKPKLKKLDVDLNVIRKKVIINYKLIRKEILIKWKVAKLADLNSVSNLKEVPDTSTTEAQPAKLKTLKKDNKLKFRVIRQNFTNQMKELILKKKACEVEVNLEKKEISNMGITFGVTHLPRFFVKMKAKKNYLIKKVKNLLEKVGLKPEHAYRYPHEFSGGQRQRIGIARAIITRPKLIIADEPISALDVSIQAQVINILKNLSKEFDCTLIFIAHDLSMISYICDEIIIMSKGRILEKGKTEAVFEKPVHPYTKELLSSVPELSNVHKNLAEKTNVKSYRYSSNQEYNFVQVGKKEHYILADEEQAKTWL